MFSVSYFEFVNCKKYLLFNCFILAAIKFILTAAKKHTVVTHFMFSCCKKHVLFNYFILAVVKFILAVAKKHTAVIHFIIEGVYSTRNRYKFYETSRLR